MELDDIQQELYKSTYKDNLQRYDVKNVAINKFLEAMSKQQRNLTDSETPIESSIINETTPMNINATMDETTSMNINATMDETTSMNINVIPTEDIGKQIITNTLITIHDHCQSREQGISNLLHDDDQVNGWNFRRGLQERLLLKEVTNVEKRNAEIATEVNGTNNESNLQLTRPVIWGTCKYRDLWVRASTIEEDVHMDNASPILLEEEEEICSPKDYDKTEVSFPTTPQSYSHRTIPTDKVMDEGS
ncbi:hypothetical protein KC19_2G143400 [Ceratodon purpureus]|uniref:Uncharacterized protein n=1 Tax=Ceratodon purpureus TaxID=3225 RepID=A0A8T0IW24_CERPU|nr:hypothetical protein KC19_2G143400 [Ceratodon purpureus]